jgi:hypothetical protein
MRMGRLMRRMLMRYDVVRGVRMRRMLVRWVLLVRRDAVGVHGGSGVLVRRDAVGVYGGTGVLVRRDAVGVHGGTGVCGRLRGRRQKRSKQSHTHDSR